MKKLLFAIFLVFMVNSCQTGDNTFTDPRDGQTYRTVKIGNQIWMAENLNYDAGEGSWCYDNNSSNCEKYGRLYNWETALRAAPPGWHIPKIKEYEALKNNLSGNNLNPFPKIVLKGDSGFDTRFSGYISDDGKYEGMDEETGFWSGTNFNERIAFYLAVYSSTKTVCIEKYTKTSAFAVRLVKDYINPDEDSLMSDDSDYQQKDDLITDIPFINPVSGKPYRTVKIGSQIWMAENLNYETPCLMDYMLVPEATQQDYDRENFYLSGSCCYDYNSSYCKIYGRLYRWETAKRLVPPGWHLPSKEEYEMLLTHLNLSGNNLLKSMIRGGSSGFNVLFGGYIDEFNNFSSVKTGARFWSFTGKGTWGAWYLDVDSRSGNVSLKSSSSFCGYSARLVKD